MSDWSVFVPWVYILIVIHLGAFWVIYHYKLKPQDRSKLPVEGKSIPMETDAWVWKSLSLFIVIISIWLQPYHPFLSESATLFIIISIYILIRQKKLDYITITDRAIIIEAKDEQIVFDRIVSIKFGGDFMEIWSKSFVQHYHEFTERELKENWELFKKELLLIAKNKEWITITTTTKSPPKEAQPPKSSPSPESETHTDK